MTQPSPFKWFKTSPEIIRLAVMMYVRFPLSLRNVEDLLHERGVEISHETVRFWWHRLPPRQDRSVHAAVVRHPPFDLYGSRFNDLRGGERRIPSLTSPVGARTRACPFDVLRSALSPSGLGM